MLRDKDKGTKNNRVVVAMSGGVDSSVAAALLKESGFDVIGISMQLWNYSGDNNFGSCCSLEDIYDARRVSYQLDIPFYVLNLEEEFSKYVVDYFVDSYLNGETPNPCLKCNEHLKFDILLNKVFELEADYLATGHYARVVYNEDRGNYRLLKGGDSSKDQSYFLFTLTQKELSRIIFPLGCLTKSEVRNIARMKGLRVSDKQESQEVCFVPDGDYPSFISKRVGMSSSGDIVDDREGKILGRHNGIYRYTIGQRKGLGISIGSPLYVTRVDKEKGRVIVGEEKDLLSQGLEAGFVNWISCRDSFPIDVDCKIRYRHHGVPSRVYFRDDRLIVYFNEPQKAVTPGQAVVMYQGDEVVGGGWIKRGLKVDDLRLAIEG